MIVVNIRHNSGFSLIELITVMILLGILGVVALGRFSGGDAFAARGFFDDTVNAVRFAQKYAISSGCKIRVITTASSYQLRQSSTCTGGDFSVLVVNPANRGNSYQNTDIPAGYTLTAGTITFTAQGVREEPTSDFNLSSGAITYRFRVHDSTGLTEVL
ncbi:MAG: prepilin-type N-terminal cleavage/methylation domain-containing protein [Gammaproteobacteria bacterium]|nr:prepilin-type N-terminal cleavage/methylation domain-containing protein [Gammaproteobacteria bacterium]